MGEQKNEIDFEELGRTMHGMPLPTWAQYFQLAELVSQLREALRQLESRAEGFDRRLELGAERFNEIERKNDQSCADIRRIDLLVDTHSQHVTEVKQLLEDIKSLLEVYDSARGTVAVLSALGGFLKWATGIGGAIALVWLWLKTGIKS
ncbi:hypothetical protein HQ393_04870 [Chitinibacter bivalviorum]|uniref:Uncharacterized protein n=1 Tax=Chitinibacter bivalviorum TaxID=2739434 RepID=A0A7H9BHG1_9NEIS|nr:hypothetical protein [Chitinibacter bivalviorum]QLG87638.1 hypothetical protein HQ393_04870 [Chitinibacter bivalviorum]